MKNFLTSFGRHLLDFAYPDICVACENRITDTRSAICFECQWDLPRNTNLLIHNESQENKFWGKVKTSGIYSFLRFTKGGKVQNILHALKYQNRPELGIFLGKLCGKALKDQHLFLHADYLVPVPLHRARLRERGYNQAGCLATGISEILEIPVRHDLLARNKSTLTQTRSGGRLSRYRNLEGVFEATETAPEVLRDKAVILVDDVLTTGATLEVAATALWKTGIRELFIVTLAAVNRS
ncbi:MAG: ComF family protein [Leadbetterella sp.]|nr:ComF family protein [Leadbetterella sp.]